MKAKVGESGSLYCTKCYKRSYYSDKDGRIFVYY